MSKQHPKRGFAEACRNKLLNIFRQKKAAGATYFTITARELHEQIGPGYNSGKFDQYPAVSDAMYKIREQHTPEDKPGVHEIIYSPPKRRGPNLCINYDLSCF